MKVRLSRTLPIRLSSVRSLATGRDLAAIFGTSNRANNVLVRMQARQRMHERAQAAIGSDHE
jgi:hypothetical protein